MTVTDEPMIKPKTRQCMVCKRDRKIKWVCGICYNPICVTCHGELQDVGAKIECFYCTPALEKAAVTKAGLVSTRPRRQQQQQLVEPVGLDYVSYGTVDYGGPMTMDVVSRSDQQIRGEFMAHNNELGFRQPPDIMKTKTGWGRVPVVEEFRELGKRTPQMLYPEPRMTGKTTSLVQSAILKRIKNIDDGVLFLVRDSRSKKRVINLFHDEIMELGLNSLPDGVSKNNIMDDVLVISLVELSSTVGRHFKSLMDDRSAKDQAIVPVRLVNETLVVEDPPGYVPGYVKK